MQDYLFNTSRNSLFWMFVRTASFCKTVESTGISRAFVFRLMKEHRILESFRRHRDVNVAHTSQLSGSIKWYIGCL